MLVDSLTGNELDKWVAYTLGYDGGPYFSIEWDRIFYIEEFMPSNDWAQAGPLISRHQMYLEYDTDGYWIAATSASDYYKGNSALEAAMRAIVAHKYGKEVPDA